MTFYDDSKLKYPDELICFTIQHEISGHHLFGKHNQPVNRYYYAIVYNMVMHNMGQHLKNLMFSYKIHSTYRKAGEALTKRLTGYKVYKHRLRTDTPENYDIIRQALTDGPLGISVISKQEQLRLSSHKISEEMFESLYKFETVIQEDIDVLNNARNILFNNYFSSAGVIKQIPWADYQHIANRKQFLETNDWKNVYAVEASLDHFAASKYMIAGRYVDLVTLVKLPLGVILLEDKPDANIFSLLNTEAKIYDITKLVKRMLHHRICE